MLFRSGKEPQNPKTPKPQNPISMKINYIVYNILKSLKNG